MDIQNILLTNMLLYIVIAIIYAFSDIAYSLPSWMIKLCHLQEKSAWVSVVVFLLIKIWT